VPTADAQPQEKFEGLRLPTLRTPQRFPTPGRWFGRLVCGSNNVRPAPDETLYITICILPVSSISYTQALYEQPITFDYRRFDVPRSLSALAIPSFRSLLSAVGPFDSELRGCRFWCRRTLEAQPIYRQTFSYLVRRQQVIAKAEGQSS
jgi:hypothetical protein